MEKDKNKRVNKLMMIMILCDLLVCYCLFICFAILSATFSLFLSFSLSFLFSEEIKIHGDKRNKHHKKVELLSSQVYKYFGQIDFVSVCHNARDNWVCRPLKIIKI